MSIPGPEPPDLADRLFAESQVIERRLERLRLAVEELAERAEVPEVWEPLRQALAATQRAAQRATNAVPNPQLGLASHQGVVGVLRVQELTIDLRARRAWLGARDLPLRRLEFELLTHLARAPDTVVSKDDLLREVWGFRAEGRTRTVDSHVSRTRRALLQAGAEPGQWLVNSWGQGYALRHPGTMERLAVGDQASGIRPNP